MRKVQHIVCCGPVELCRGQRQGTLDKSAGKGVKYNAHFKPRAVKDVEGSVAAHPVSNFGEEDLRSLREAKALAKGAPTVGLADLKRKLRVSNRMKTTACHCERSEAISYP